MSALTEFAANLLAATFIAFFVLVAFATLGVDLIVLYSIRRALKKAGVI